MTGRIERKSSKESGPYVDYDTNNAKFVPFRKQLLVLREQI